MPEYRVTWEIDVEADSPVDAAEKARHYQTKPDTTATVFDVRERVDEAETFHVDLLAVEEGGACRDCGKVYEEGGDGYNGRCPDCADSAEEEGRADD